jgi:hypothetical protein
MDDDRRPCVTREQRRQPADRAGLGRVCVEDLRTLQPDQPREPHDGECVSQRRDLPVQLRDRDHLHPKLLGDERHRLLAAREATGDEGRDVAPLAEARSEIRDVERRPAHVEAGDDAHDPDRFRHRG